MYSIIRPILFRLDAETAHGITFKLLEFARVIGLLELMILPPVGRPTEVMGIRFASRVGLAAGLDKDGEHVDALVECGFAFVEVGTVTPRPQPGNDKPRMFRVKSKRAIINRMGFNNKGVDHLVEQVRERKNDCVLGVNIGKNKDTPNEKALDDYIYCLRAAHEVADYIAVNISSPNTPGLRELQSKQELKALITGLQAERDALTEKTGKRVPLAVKIAPDLTDDELKDMVLVFRLCKIDAVIATNTTNSREGVEGERNADEQGGLSGEPLRERSNTLLKRLIELLYGEIPVIAVGGVMSPADAAEKIHLGAKLVQLYSGFIYSGPAIVSEAVTATNIDF